jgi:hypothetical protein
MKLRKQNHSYLTLNQVIAIVRQAWQVIKGGTPVSDKPVRQLSKLVYSGKITFEELFQTLLFNISDVSEDQRAKIMYARFALRFMEARLPKAVKATSVSPKFNSVADVRPNDDNTNATAA